MSRAVARAILLHMLPDCLASAGVEAEAIFRKAGMTLDDVASSSVVLRSQINHVLALSARCLGIAEIGLSLGAAADPGSLGPIGLAMKAGATPEACLQAQIDRMPTMQSLASLELRKEGDECVWAHCLVGDGEDAWLHYEGAAAFNVRMLRSLMGNGWAPERVTFPHGCKGRRQTYEDYFQAPVHFGEHGEARIHMRRGALSEPLRNATCGRGDRFPPAQDWGRIEAFRLREPDISVAIGRMVDASLAQGAVTLQAAARVLGLSPRTLQRRLKHYGMAFEEIVDERRRDLATMLLKTSQSSMTDIAMMLGYSDAPHFNRAFQRWEGLTPMDYRRHHTLPGTDD